MNGVRNENQFAMKRCTNKNKKTTKNNKLKQKKKYQLNKKRKIDKTKRQMNKPPIVPDHDRIIKVPTRSYRLGKRKL